MAAPLRARLPGLTAPGLVVAAGALPGLAEACAVCVGWGREGQGLNPGFYWGALLLSALPFAVAAAVGAWIRRAGGRKDPDPGGGARRAAGPRPPAP